MGRGLSDEMETQILSATVYITLLLTPGKLARSSPPRTRSLLLVMSGAPLSASSSRWALMARLQWGYS